MFQFSNGHENGWKYQAFVFESITVLLFYCTCFPFLVKNHIWCTCCNTSKLDLVCIKHKFSFVSYCVQYLSIQSNVSFKWNRKGFGKILVMLQRNCILSGLKKEIPCYEAKGKTIIFHFSFFFYEFYMYKLKNKTLLWDDCETVKKILLEIKISHNHPVVVFKYNCYKWKNMKNVSSTEIFFISNICCLGNKKYKSQTISSCKNLRLQKI